AIAPFFPFSKIAAPPSSPIIFSSTEHHPVPIQIYRSVYPLQIAFARLLRSGQELTPVVDLSVEGVELGGAALPCTRFTIKAQWIFVSLSIKRLFISRKIMKFQHSSQEEMDGSTGPIDNAPNEIPTQPGDTSEVTGGAKGGTGLRKMKPRSKAWSHFDMILDGNKKTDRSSVQTLLEAICLPYKMKWYLFTSCSFDWLHEKS
ncbi:type III pantothenate kinase, partial [Striga asiatica]